ncbi:Mor transcription activator family protein [Levilactobacillus angrenensis]|uniref:Mor transcription activator family protein n=1 Tax=Levilactobacillus angrenensis TaxID=2486020 RepID=A0ABW1UAJ8_9LACO|nr:Mor transcription activator family protein [Levilactobacillus angrenensis]
MGVDTQALQGIYKKLNELLGTEEMMKFYQEFRGTQLNLPMKLYGRDGTVAAIKEKYPQMTEKELADRYGYSQRWVKRVISEAEKQQSAGE